MKEILFLARRVVVNAILINKNMLIIYVLVTFIANSPLKEKKETQYLAISTKSKCATMF